MIWRPNLHQSTSLVKAQKALEAHGCKFSVTNLSIVPHTLVILTANVTYCINFFELLISLKWTRAWYNHALLAWLIKSYVQQTVLLYTWANLCQTDNHSQFQSQSTPHRMVCYCTKRSLHRKYITTWTSCNWNLLLKQSHNEEVEILTAHQTTIYQACN